MKKFSIIFLTIIIGLFVFADIYFNDPDGFDRELPNAEYLLDKAPDDFKWGDADVQLLSGPIGEFSFDVDYNTGILYALTTTWNGGAPDTFNLYDSHDNGETWNYRRVIMVNSDGELLEPKIIVTDDGKIACFGLYVETNGTRYVILREYNDSLLTTYHWEYPSRFTADTVYSFDIDYADNYYYMAYNAINITSSPTLSLYGATLHEDSVQWVNQINLYSDLQSNEAPKIAVGPNGNAYAAFIEERTDPGVNNIRVKRTYDYGATWLGSQAVSALTSQVISHLDVAASRDLNFQSVWFTVQFDNMGTFGYYYSADSCVTNQYGTVITTLPGWDESMGTIGIHPTQDWITLAFNADSTGRHDVYFAYCLASGPTNFLQLQKINQYNATGTYPPIGGNIIGNSAVMYAGWGPSDLYFDTYISNLGIEDEIVTLSTPNVYTSAPIFNANISVFFNLDNETFVNLHIIDATGRIVKDFNAYYQKGNNSIIWNGNDNRGNTVPNGTYFYRVSFGSETYSGKITYLK